MPCFTGCPTASARKHARPSALCSPSLSTSRLATLFLASSVTVNPLSPFCYRHLFRGTVGEAAAVEFAAVLDAGSLLQGAVNQEASLHSVKVRVRTALEGVHKPSGLPAACRPGEHRIVGMTVLFTFAGGLRPLAGRAACCGKAGCAQRVRSEPSRHGTPRKSTRSSSTARPDRRSSPPACTDRGQENSASGPPPRPHRATTKSSRREIGAGQLA